MLHAALHHGSRRVDGGIIASLGSAWVFVLNTLLSLMAAYGVVRWRREHKESPLGREPLGSAIRVGLQFVRESKRMRGVLARMRYTALAVGHLLRQKLTRRSAKV